MIKQFSDNEIKNTYKMICDYYEKYLKLHGVKLPRLADNKGNYTKDALVLVYLAQDYPKTKVISKGELTQFVRKYYSRGTY